MKKLFVLVLVLAISTMATAASVTLRVAEPQTEYNPSDTITIELLADFYVTYFGIDYVYGEPTASNPVLHSLFTVPPVTPGTLVNSGGTLMVSVAGGVAADLIEDGVPIGEVLWSFDYHIPDVEESTVLVISGSGVAVADCWWVDSVSSIGALEIHVVPEPMTIALLGIGGLFLRRRK